MYKALGFLAQNKFSIEIGTMAVGGITISQLAFADMALKVLIGVFTLTMIVLKTIKDFKK